MEYTPRYLDPQSLQGLYQDMIRQAEAAEAQAWINYRRAVEARKAVEEDIQRLSTQPAPEIPQAEPEAPASTPRK